MTKLIRCLIMVFVLLPIAHIAMAGDGEGSVDSGDQRSVYEENLRKWHSMSEEERQAIRDKVRAMDPQERQAIRDNARKFRQLPREDRERIHRNYQRYRDLPNDKKELIRERSRRFERDQSRDSWRPRRELKNSEGSTGAGPDRHEGYHDRRANDVGQEDGQRPRQGDAARDRGRDFRSNPERRQDNSNYVRNDINEKGRGHNMDHGPRRERGGLESGHGGPGRDGRGGGGPGGRGQRGAGPKRK